jgi:hypothetical protein
VAPGAVSDAPSGEGGNPDATEPDTADASADAEPIADSETPDASDVSDGEPGGDAPTPDASADASDATADDVVDASEDTTQPADADAGSDDDAQDTSEPDAVAPGCGPESREVTVQGKDVCVDRWEAARPDATAANPGGNDSGAAVAKAGVLPWAMITQQSAAAACEAAGKRLCTFEELAVACEGPLDDLLYPYGSTYSASACNGHKSGFAKALPTGAINTCESPVGLLDVSGNLQEWTSTTLEDGSICTFGGDYTQGAFSALDNEAQESCRPGEVIEDLVCWSFPVGSVQFTNLGFRCCKDKP